MAGDWIKMRSDLYRDPKVSVMADELLGNQGELARYVSQMNQRDMCVTRNVMRNATVGALVSVWGVIRQRGKRVDDDLACSGVALGVIDDIADLPGFGQAMASVGWIIESAEGLVFPRFFEEHNVDPAERTKATNADRQRRYRERKQAEESDVTRDVTVTPREEKSREEEKNPPNPPAGAEGVKSGRKKRDKIPFAAFLDACQETGESAIPKTDPIFTFAKDTGIPRDFLLLAWREFSAKHLAGRKLQADWRAHFRDAVRRNWFKLWWFPATGSCELTTAGVQLARERDAERVREQERVA